MLRFLIPIVILFLAALLFSRSACTKAPTKTAPVAATTPLTQLAGSEWGPEVDGGPEQFVNFSSGGELNGSGGCNNFFGTYTQTEDTLTIGPLAVSRKMCPEGMDAEQAFIQALQNSVGFEATHRQLTLKDASGHPVLLLRRRDWD